MKSASEFREIADGANINANRAIIRDIMEVVSEAANAGWYDVNLKNYKIGDLSIWLRDYLRQHGYELTFDQAGTVNISWK